MESKEIRVECPCCQSRLDIDVRTSQVLRWRKQEQADPADEAAASGAGWSTAADRVHKRLGAAADKFDDSLTRERTRAKDLDDLFRKANEKLGRGDEG